MILHANIAFDCLFGTPVKTNNCMKDRCGIGIYDGNIAVNVRICRRLFSEQKKIVI
jgi:hypothetical protein